jgi:two-component system, sensor histidine kinase and response regulator
MEKSSLLTEKNTIIKTKIHQQSKTATFFICILVGVVLLVLPFVRDSIFIPPLFASSFISSASILISFGDFITAYLLFGQFRHTRTLPIAILAATYLFGGLICIPHTLTLPEIFSTNGSLHAETQTAIWLYVFWHAGLSIGFLIYVISNKFHQKTAFSIHKTHLILVLLLASMLALTSICYFISAYQSSFLPILIDAKDFTPMIISGIGPGLLLVTLLACAAVFFLLPHETLLYGWIRVTTVASLLDVTMILYSGSRYSIGWYISRSNSVITALVVLFALLYENNQLYEKVAEQNEILVKQQDLQNNFIAVVGHEFRTALTSIQGFSELMHVEDLSSDDVKEFAGDINTDVTRLNRLINDLLDLERMKSSSTTLHLSQIDINSLLTNVVERMQPVLTRKQLQFKLDLDIKLACLNGDPDKLIQLFLNLLNNAIKYSPKDSEIFIRSREENTMAHIMIQDQGRGIPADQLDKVFDRYVRVEMDVSRYVSGTGLGLTIVKQIVDLHQGQIWVESVLLQGSTFHVMLPLAIRSELVAVGQKLSSSKRA